MYNQNLKINSTKEEKAPANANEPSKKRILKTIDSFKRRKRIKVKEIYLHSTLTISQFSLEFLKQNEFNKEAECVICQETVHSGEMHYLHCGHKFHCICINTWFQQNPNNKICPLCKRKPCQEDPLDIVNEWELLNIPDIPHDRINQNDIDNDLLSDITLILMFCFCIILSIFKISLFYASIKL